MNFLKSVLGGGDSGARQMNAAEARERISSSEPLYILDVRETEEFRAGHLQNAHLIPLNQLSKRINDLPKDQDILCVCASGSRSSMAARMLAGAGYKVINLRGGMFAWQSAGYPIKR